LAGVDGQDEGAIDVDVDLPFVGVLLAEQVDAGTGEGVGERVAVGGGVVDVVVDVAVAAGA
jgi:hypothetical protein